MVKGLGKDKKPDKMYKVTCNFDDDNPTMIIGEAIKEGIIVNSECAKFTLDKRKVGFEKMACECKIHVKKI